MKKLMLTLIIAAFVAPALVFSQGKHVSDLVDKYQADDEITSIIINPGAIQINAGNDKESKVAGEVLDQINKLKILKLEDNIKKGMEFYEEAAKAIQKDGFTEMIKVNSDDEEVGFYVLEDDSGNIKECALLVSEDDEVALIYIEGTISFSNLVGMMNDMDIDIDVH